MQTFPRPTQTRLLILAGLFLFCYALALTLSPAVRARSWEADYRWDHWLGVAVWVIGVYFANREMQKHTLAHDVYLFPVVALLSGWGMLTIWRLTPVFGLRQTIWLGLAFVVFALGLRLPKDLGFLRRYKYLWLTSGLLLTAATLFFGINPANTGPEQWLGCCGVYLQPSEPLKLLLIAYLAAYLADRQLPHARAPLIPLLAPTVVMTGMALLLLIVQRDLGTAMIFLFIYASMIYLGTNRQWIIFASLAGMVAVSVAGYLFFDLVRLRVDAWLNPWADPTGRSYQIVQSLIAIASGEVFGRGPGVGSPGLVPLAHSDFIFTAVAEEGGLIGTVGLIGLLALLLNRGLNLALRAQDNYRRFLAAGVTTYLIAQSILIIGGNLRLLPLTGVTLPFVSYGGSSLMTSFMCLLLLTLIGSTAIPKDGKRVSAPLLDPAPALGISNPLLAGLGAAALFASWWIVFRGPDLLIRTDNPRLAIADRFVYRGFFLDQRGNRLVINQGEPGEITRLYLEPSLSPVIGYANPIFGQAGLEASLDTYLRGLEGPDWMTIWFDQFLYGQHPPGVDVRLSIDLEIQQEAYALLGEHIGAVVLLNAHSGEILAMVSSPTYDANELETSWPTLLADPRAPLLNRATQGAYPPGTALGPLLLAARPNRNTPFNVLSPETAFINNAVLACVKTPATISWGTTIQAGCPAPTLRLGEILGENLLNLFTSLGLYSLPSIRLPAASSPVPASLSDPPLAALGQDLTISPLQLALAVAVLSNEGIRPSPRLVIAYHAPGEEWQPFTPLGGGPQRIFSTGAANQTAQMLTAPNRANWESVSVILGEGGENAPALTWYQGGTLPDWAGVPVVVVVLLEEGNPDFATEIGRGVLDVVLSGD